MKLLFDQNLSYKLAIRVAELFPGSMHVRDVGLKESDDQTVWDYAKEHGFLIVSKDSDFHQKSFVTGAPPQLIWVRLGNCTTNDIEAVLRKHFSDIEKFAQDKEATFLLLS